jgi:hypothetical protein
LSSFPALFEQTCSFVAQVSCALCRAGFLRPLSRRFPAPCPFQANLLFSGFPDFTFQANLLFSGFPDFTNQTSEALSNSSETQIKRCSNGPAVSQSSGPTVWNQNSSFDQNRHFPGKAPCFQSSVQNRAFNELCLYLSCFLNLKVENDYKNSANK